MKGANSKPEPKSSSLAVKKKTKDSKAGMPKRPSSAFFVFMYTRESYGDSDYRETFRKQYKEEHPKNKSVAVVGKAGGVKWKSMSEDEKAPFVEMAEERKAEYEKNVKAYHDKLENDEANAEDEGSDKSGSEVHDEDEDGSGEEDDV